MRKQYVEHAECGRTELDLRSAAQLIELVQTPPATIKAEGSGSRWLSARRYHWNREL
jgi:hypothetical protein